MQHRAFLSSAICFFLLLLTFRLSAHPYASGVTNKAGTVSWVLNEPATDVKIVYDNGKSTNDLGAAPLVGTNTFSLAGHTNFSIVVFKIGSNAVTQISSDANADNSFGGPAGVVINQNAKTANFGRVYIANADPIVTALRGTTRGIYALDAASEDFLGLGNTAATAGMSLGSDDVHSPFKLGLGPDDALYVGDAGSGKIGGVWRIDANLVSAADLFELANASGNKASSGTNFGRAIGTPNVTGTLAAGNLALTITMYDLNLANPAGTYAGSPAYQNIYQYHIGAGPLPWKNFPTVVVNPISIGTVNGVTMDAQVAPDGKYFISAYRYSPAEGVTNVCVLDSTGSHVLWDSKTQSRSYFNDPSNDHLDFANTSISVSPDDKYVLIQGSTNTTFLIMSLTNGIPDISTLTTNSPAAATSGATCWASAWDAADNVYVTSASSQSLRVFSLGLTTTCTTSNDSTSTNGSFNMTVASSAPVIQVQPSNQIAECTGNASFSVMASGQSLSYQWFTGGTRIATATNSTLTINDVSVGQSGSSYQVVVSNNLASVTSQPALLTVADTIPPVVTLNGSATVSLDQGAPFTDPGATANDACAGSVSVTTTGAVNVNQGGTYIISYSATDPSSNSSTNTRTVIVIATNGPPVIATQPASTTVECGSSASLSVFAGGSAPLYYQWYSGSTPLVNGPGVSGATSPMLTIAAESLQGASYYAVVTNSDGRATSQPAILSAQDTTPPVITVSGSTVVTATQGASYIDAGATAQDACAGPVNVTTQGSVNTSQPGAYILTYTATDPSGNSATANRVVNVVAAPQTVKVSSPNLVPLPVTLQTRPGVFLLCPAQPTPPVPSHALMKILVDSASQQTGQYLAASLFKSTGYQFQVINSASTSAVKGAILVTTANAVASLGPEGYELTVAPDSVVIRAPGQAGAFYGVQTFLQLLPPQIYSARMVSGVTWAAPCVYIEDQPQFSWRGVMLDVSRHFFNKQEVKQLLDAMAMHKLNTFHWHLVDDQGWRLQITNYLNLTVAGAYRSGIDYGLPPRASTATNLTGQYGGYYTQADAREIVAYAQQLHITVVPEIEMPCHSTAGLASYPQFGCGNPVGDYNMDYPNIDYGVDLYSLAAPGTMAFFEDVLTEVMGIFPGKYIHCGGDEVVSSGDTQWNSYSYDKAEMNTLGISGVVAYQHWLSTNLAGFLQARGRTMMGWTEFENGGILPNAALMDWETGSSSQAIPTAEAGQPVVMSPDSSCYINYLESTDTAFEPPFLVGGAPAYDSLSTVYNFNPLPSGLPAQYDTNILGAQCTLFGEYVPSFENVMFKMFPRAAAMAELTWTPRALQSYASFTNRLVTHEQRLTEMGVNYNHETIPQIGTWGPSVSTSPTVMSWNITTNVTASGEIDVNFTYTTGADGLAITSVALLQNGAQVDLDAHSGFAGASSSYTLYILHLPETKPGATYTIQATVAGSGGSASSGVVYLPNWN